MIWVAGGKVAEGGGIVFRGKNLFRSGIVVTGINRRKGGKSKGANNRQNGAKQLFKYGLFHSYRHTFSFNLIIIS